MGRRVLRILDALAMERSYAQRALELVEELMKSLGGRTPWLRTASERS